MMMIMNYYYYYYSYSYYCCYYYYYYYLYYFYYFFFYSYSYSAAKWTTVCDMLGLTCGLQCDSAVKGSNKTILGVPGESTPMATGQVAPHFSLPRNLP